MDISTLHDNKIILAFVTGLTIGLLLFMISICFTVDEERPASAGHLFESEHTSEDEDDFREFIVKRLVQSSAFRCKMINGMVKLHQTNPKIYSDVMRK